MRILFLCIMLWASSVWAQAPGGRGVRPPTMERAVEGEGQPQRTYRLQYGAPVSPLGMWAPPVPLVPGGQRGPSIGPPSGVPAPETPPTGVTPPPVQYQRVPAQITGPAGTVSPRGGNVYDVYPCPTCVSAGTTPPGRMQHRADAIIPPSGDAPAQVAGPVQPMQRSESGRHYVIPETGFTQSYLQCTTCGDFSHVRNLTSDQYRDSVQPSVAGMLLRAGPLRTAIRRDSIGCPSGTCTGIVWGTGSAEGPGGRYDAIHGQCVTCGAQGTVITGPNGYQGVRAGPPVHRVSHMAGPSPDRRTRDEADTAAQMEFLREAIRNGPIR